MAKRGRDADDLVDEKRRKVNPTLWSADDVAGYLINKCGLSIDDANSICVSGAGMASALAAFDQVKVPDAKREVVYEALQELSDPLMPKFMLYGNPLSF